MKGRRRYFPIAWNLPLLLAGMLLTGPAGRAEHPLSARQIREYGSGATPPLFMPTAVAVDGRGHVFIADGVHDRVVEFDAEGAYVADITAVGDQRLKRPIGLKTDATGRLWITDTDHHRVLIRRPDGTPDAAVELPSDTAAQPPEITDVLPDADGRGCWLVDNRNHQLIRLEPGQTSPRTVGRKGEPLGSFHFPFMIAGRADGDLFVTDVINARVVALNREGAPLSSIGRYGLDIGQLYRPKGIAVDREGRVWVSDSIIGCVQVFTPTGRPIDVLRDGRGDPLRLDTPMGLTFDDAGRLYVVELVPGRVRQFEIAAAPRIAPRFTPGTPAKAAQPRQCTVCHLEWMEPFASNGDSSLVARPAVIPDSPVVGRAEICLSCHDGSVGDSRRIVWSEHGHQTGQKPPPGMTVPPTLPLIDGRLACRTCHSAHSEGQPQQADIESSFFLRLPSRDGRLCMACHTDKVGGPATGAHPIGGMPWPIPEALIAAGARPGTNPRELTCEVCHIPHGAHEERLLVMGIDSSQLCLTCHEKLRPGLWVPDAPRDHPQNPPLSSEVQRRAITEMGTRIGRDGTLICLSCHKMHHGQPGHYILAETLSDSRLCLRCHPEREDMFGTRHDLRVSAPRERNRLGLTPQASGPCGACHSFHQFARRPAPRPDDPPGLCRTCHQPGQCAERVSGDPFSHPLSVRHRGPDTRTGQLHLYPDENDPERVHLACLTCHNPHETRHPRFLQQEPDRLCAECHADNAVSLGGAHDFRARRGLTNLKNQTPDRTGNCGFCHAVHDARGPVLWAGAAMPEGYREPNDLCLSCHHPEGPARDQRGGNLRHPGGAAIAGKIPTQRRLTPLLDQNLRESPEGMLVCATCHDVHADSRKFHALLRYPPTSQPAAVCQDCHLQVVSIEQSLHADTWMQKELGPPAEGSVAACAACHVVHASPASRAVGMWAAPPGPAEYPEDMRRCLGCHGPGGKATPVPTVVRHPIVPMRNAVGSEHPAYMPLIDEAGTLGDAGRITCQTCHQPHGRADDPSYPDKSLADMSPIEQRALASLVRPYRVPNLCSNCHGSRGLAYYLYYHYPEKRRTMEP